MREFILVGRPNSGKTLFAINFAAYLNCPTIDILSRNCDGTLHYSHHTIYGARRLLCSPQRHTTRCIQTLSLQLTVGKSAVPFKLHDCCGLEDKIHRSETIRRSMAQTLSLVQNGDRIIHVLDLSVSCPVTEAAAGIDQEIYQLGLSRKRYLLLANKIDLPAAADRYEQYRSHYPDVPILSVSALQGKGFQAVKTFVAGSL